MWAGSGNLFIFLLVTATIPTQKMRKKLPIFQLKNSQNSFLKSRIFFSNLPKNKNSFSLIELDVKSDIIFPQLSLSTFSFLHA